jgi:hypothetical protein
MKSAMELYLGSLIELAIQLEHLLKTTTQESNVKAMQEIRESLRIR